MSAKKTRKNTPAAATPRPSRETAAETTYRTPAKRAARVAETATANLPDHYSEIAEVRGSGVVRRKNLNIDQGLLDQARSVLGVNTETEAVAMGLGAVIELVEFHAAMVEGFDRLVESGEFTHDPGETLDFSGFYSAPAR